MSGGEPEVPPPEGSGPDSASSDPPIPRLPRHFRKVFLFTGVVLPAICFALSFPERPDWQSGSIESYAQLLLSWKSSSPFYPFLLYSMVCLVLVAFAPGRHLKNPVVRFGVYTGVVLALHHWLVFQAATGAVVAGNPAESAARLLGMALFSALAVAIPWAVLRALFSLAGTSVMEALWGAAVVILLFASVVLLPLPLVLCLWCSTPWAVATYVAMTVYVARHSRVERLRFSLAQLFGLVGWLAAYLGAWRTSFIWTLQEYARLPTTAPQDCYVSTAAAKGHRWLVRSEANVCALGSDHRVNDQMRFLKAGELLLASVSPTAHRACRWIYDRVGPLLAAALVHPVLADVSYLLLKPPEWLCRAALALVLRGQRQLIRGVYGPGDGRRGRSRSVGSR